MEPPWRLRRRRVGGLGFASFGTTVRPPWPVLFQTTIALFIHVPHRPGWTLKEFRSVFVIKLCPGLGPPAHAYGSPHSSEVRWCSKVSRDKDSSEVRQGSSHSPEEASSAAAPGVGQGCSPAGGGAQDSSLLSVYSLHCFLSSSGERGAPGCGSHKRDFFGGPGCGGMNSGVAAYIPGRQPTAGDWTKCSVFIGVLGA